MRELLEIFGLLLVWFVLGFFVLRWMARSSSYEDRCERERRCGQMRRDEEDN